MSKPYDASTKYLVDQYLPDWLALSHIRTANRVRIIDADLSTVTAEADKVLRVEDPAPWIFHLELQSSRDEDLGRRLHWYNALLEYKHKMMVHSLVVLLRREADAASLTGEISCQFPDQPPYRFFRYQVVRFWEVPVESVLSGGLGLLPLAPLCDEAVGSLPAVVRRMSGRIERESADAQSAATLWTAADVLMGLRYEPQLIERVLQGVSTMKESATYQAIVEEGKLEALRANLIRQGRKKFGGADPASKAAIESITDLGRLEELGERLLEVSGWQELLV